MKDKKKPGSEFSELYLFGFILLVAFLWRISPQIQYLWQHLRGPVVMGLWTTAGGFAVLGILKLWNQYALRKQEESITEEDEFSVFLGKAVDDGREIHLKESFRTMHAQVIGTTNAGKSESVILPWAIQDIKNGSGVLILDGKSDASFVNKLYAYVKHYGREKDFRLFALANPGPSSSFNPLKGDSAQEVTERVFSSFAFENEYYKNIQYRIFLNLVRLVFAQKETPTFSLIHRLLVDAEELEKWAIACSDEMLSRDVLRFLKLSEKDREEKTSGLETMLSHFTVGDVSVLFQETDHAIQFDEALQHNHILYFQLPTMYFPFLASATGKLVLQCFQNAVSKRQISLGGVKDGAA
jgi:hypothetical protein